MLFVHGAKLRRILCIQKGFPLNPMGEIPISEVSEVIEVILMFVEVPRLAVLAQYQTVAAHR